MMATDSMEEALVQSYLSFRVGKELFAAEVSKVLSILEMVHITPVPHSPEEMLGVINLRGAVIPVIDSRIRFGIQPSPYTRNTCIIVMEIETEAETFTFGVLVDAVQEVIESAVNAIKPTPSMGSRFKPEFLKGILHLQEEFILILDVDKIFSSDELLLISENTPKEEE